MAAECFPLWCGSRYCNVAYVTSTEGMAIWRIPFTDIGTDGTVDQDPELLPDGKGDGGVVVPEILLGGEFYSENQRSQ